MRYLGWLLVLALLVSGCSSTKPKQFSEIYPGDINNITHLVMLDGSTGEVRQMTTQDQIQAYHDLMDEITFTRQSNWQRRAGFRYWIDIYEGQTQKQRLTFTGSFVQVEGFTFPTLGEKIFFPLLL